MRKVLFTVFCLLNIYVLKAQTPACVPNQQFKDSLAGVYPLPLTDVNPKGGIDKPACLGKPYSFIFTVKVTDTVNVILLGQPRAIPLDSITVARTNGIENMPVGLTYACNPPSCAFPKRSFGCVVISGTPTTVNQIRVYDLFIKGKVYSPLLALAGLLDGYDVTFPGDIAPGKYSISLLANNDAKCTASATNDLSDEISNLTLSPNPSSVSSTVLIEAKLSGQFNFDVYDLLGKNVLHRPLSIQAGFNKIDITTESLSNGVYIYSLTKGNRVSSGKLIVNK
jgi:Secretion system C-terminal sorting domain